MRVRLLLQCFALLLSAFTLHAFGQGGTITNGQIVSGHLVGTQMDTWSFTIPQGVAGVQGGAHGFMYVCASVDYTIANDFEPYMQLGPDGTTAISPGPCWAYQNFGPNTITVSNRSSNPGAAAGDYELKLTMSAVPYTVQGSGGAMRNGVYNGTAQGYLYDIWNFNANAGDQIAVSISGTTQGSVCVSSTIGVPVASCGLMSATFTASATTGFYIFVEYAAAAGVPGAYQLQLSGSTAVAPDGADNGAYCQQCSAGGIAAGDPVNIATGSLFEQTTDYTSPGPNILSFGRYYNSGENKLNLHATLMGVNWRSTYDRYLSVGASNAYLERPDGQTISFTLQGSTWVADNGADYKLQNVGSYIWTVTCPNDDIETYNLGGSFRLGLIEIQSRNGYFQIILFNASGTQIAGVEDAYGRIINFILDTAGHITAVTTPENSQINFTYAGNGASELLTTAAFGTAATPSQATQTYLYETAALPYAMTGITDEDNNRYATWVYDGSSRVTSSQHAAGADLHQFAYDDSTGNRTVTGPLGQQETYKFATLQGVPKLTEVDRIASSTVPAATRTQGYDANGYVTTQTDWNGNTRNLTNNSHGLPTTIVEAAGSSVARTTTITYDTTWVHLPASIVTSGLTTAYTYDGTTGNPLTKTQTDTTGSPSPTRKWIYTYQSISGFQLIHTLKGPRTDLNATTTYAYNSAGYLSSIIDPLGHMTQITTFTGGGLPSTIVDPNGVTTRLTDDIRQRLTSSAVQTAAGVLTTSFAYDAAGNLLSTTLPDKSSLTNTYDAAHRLTAVADALGDKAAYTLDSAGDQTQATVTDPASAVRRTGSDAFDALGRLLQNTGGAGQVTRYGYDGDGNATAITDPLNRVTARVFDPLNRLSQTTDPAKGVTAETYDAHDRPLSVTAPNGALTSYTYDGFGDLTQTVSPDSGTAVYSYDAAGNLMQKTDASGAITNYTYDALNRVLTKTYPGDPAENVAYSYDQSGHGFGIGRLTGMTDQLGSLARTYDERGNVLAETRVANGRTIGTAYSYDAASRLSSITYPSGTKVSYSRDAAGQVSKVATQGGVVASGVTHLPFGPVNSFIFGNGIADARTFDLDYRMTGLVDQASGMPKTQALAYGYDLANNVKTITDGVRPYLSQTLGYDMLDRLTSAAATDYGSFAWTYDPNGNRLTESRGPGSLTTGYGYAPVSNRLASLSVGGTTTQTYSYTPTGQLAGVVDQGGSTISGASYNQANRPVTSSGYGQIVAAYGYDGFGQRLGKLIPGTTPTGALFQYGQDGSLLEEADLTAAVKADYIYLDGVPIGDLAPATHTLAYLHTDHLGTPQLATDNSKALIWGAAYYPFGGTSYLAGSITQNLRLPGQYFDAETQFYHNGFRDYAPGFGRYVESDPIGLGGGLNTYAYAENSPGRLVDPFGLDDGEEYGPPAPGYGPPEANPSSRAGGSNSLLYGPPQQYGPPTAAQQLEAAAYSSGPSNSLTTAQSVALAKYAARALYGAATVAALTGHEPQAAGLAFGATCAEAYVFSQSPTLAGAVSGLIGAVTDGLGDGVSTVFTILDDAATNIGLNPTEPIKQPNSNQ